jgi:hypothetical protein
MTGPMEWLNATQGLAGLGRDEIDSMRDFTLLWGLFEGKAMATNGSQPAVVAAVDRMAIAEPLSVEFTEALAFWRDRYWQGGQPTDACRALNFAQNRYRTLALAVLSGESEDPGEVVKVLLLIAMRLRNNLFHGVKWQYRLQGQLQNFTHANAVLMRAIALTPPPAPE